MKKMFEAYWSKISSGENLETKDRVSTAMWRSANIFSIIIIESFIEILLITRFIVWLCSPLNPPLYITL